MLDVVPVEVDAGGHDSDTTTAPAGNDNVFNDMPAGTDNDNNVLPNNCTDTVQSAAEADGNQATQTTPTSVPSTTNLVHSLPGIGAP